MTTQASLPPGFLDALRRQLPAAAILLEPEQTSPFECDALFHLHQRPLAVLLPENEAQVAAVLRLCAGFGVPLVPRGAGTGLSGGAQPQPEGIVMSVNRLKAIEIEPLLAQAQVQPGRTNLSVSQAAQPHGLFFAPDPSSQLASSIGGNIAENAGGVHCVKYGLTVHNVLGLRLALSGGEVLSLGEGSLDLPGYDLPALVSGSEGLLGIVTQARLRLLPVPAAVSVLLAFFPTIAGAADAVSAIVMNGITAAGLEIMDRRSLAAANGFAPELALDLEAGAALLCELDGSAEEVAAATAAVDALLRDMGARDIRRADDEHERAALWKARKSILPALLRSTSDLYVCDCTVPRAKLGAAIDAINAVAAKHGIEIAHSFHAGDGNLHPTLLYDARNPGEEERAHRASNEIMKLVLDLGGTISGEHGVGSEKLDGMCMQFGADELDIFQGLKHAFDPAGILNPGKAVPALHRCAEFGAMHMHAKSATMPGINRF